MMSLDADVGAVSSSIDVSPVHLGPWKSTYDVDIIDYVLVVRTRLLAKLYFTILACMASLD